ncbi:hypothetical protein BDP27DRAFT_1421621 [Rhodocollybia butyracea]|uniref:Uncharacterized protein n=1 Tax=Rhodocollybia butyracea TaxID=206335 RepID=A0A9P5PMU3_9AGAR|nr:hypothetical protein BDP27DRAFT_1421621 [Rhodocollybia butyracea]
MPPPIISPFSIPPSGIVPRIGRVVRRSNIPNEQGFHPWSEYQIEPIQEQPFIIRSTDPTHPVLDAFVDPIGLATSYPIDLGLRWVYEHPDNHTVHIVYARDTQLRWTEVVAGVRSGVVPERYVPEVGSDGARNGPMTREWFLDMASQFTITEEGVLLKNNRKVCQDATDFEWKAMIMLPQQIGDINWSLYTPERLVNLVRDTFDLWHLDSLVRASAVLEHYNSIPYFSHLSHFSIKDTTTLFEILHNSPPSSVSSIDSSRDSGVGI